MEGVKTMRTAPIPVGYLSRGMTIVACMGVHPATIQAGEELYLLRLVTNDNYCITHAIMLQYTHNRGPGGRNMHLGHLSPTEWRAYEAGMAQARAEDWAHRERIDRECGRKALADVSRDNAKMYQYTADSLWAELAKMKGFG